MEKTDREELTLAVYEIVRTIPRGRATSYGAIARAIGRANHSRLVGRIMGACDSAKNGIPAHRVVNSQGILSGSAAFGDPMQMQRLLEAEGVTVRGNRIANWTKIFWNPIDEIQL